MGYIGGLGRLLLAATVTMMGAAGALAYEPDPTTRFGQRLVILPEPFPAPTAPLETLDGDAKTFADYRGRPVLALYWATWCGVCRVEMPELNAVAAEIEAAGVTVLPVSVDSGDDATLQVEAYFDQHALDAMESVWDVDGGNAQSFGLRGTPTAMVLNAEGDIIAVLEGRGEWSGAEALKFLKSLAAE